MIDNHNRTAVVAEVEAEVDYRTVAVVEVEVEEVDHIEVAAADIEDN